MTLDLIKDSYDRKARLYPAMLVVLPLALTLGAVVSLKLSLVESVATALASCGGAFLLTQLARDGGKRAEIELFQSWGGVPSVTILRHGDGRIDAITKARYHKKLGSLVKGTKAPTEADETMNLAVADRTYNAWSTYLRGKTRDTEQYGLLFKENVNYGYRRNVWGLRYFGIASSALSFCVSSWALFSYRDERQLRGEFVLATSATVFLLFMWFFIVSPRWVQIAADAYAERLIETVDSL